MKRLLIFCVAMMGVAGAARCAPSADEEARFLAGMPVRGTELEKLSGSKAWAEHATAFDRAWAQLEKHQLAQIAAWGPDALGHYYSGTGPVVYFFSGPDFLYAHAFFPNATTYVMCGIEPIGTPPQVENVPPEALGPELGAVRDSLDTLLDFSFFITKKMKTQLEETRLGGTLPLLYIFLARSGCHIRDVSMVALDPKGQFTTGKTLAPGVKIEFTGPAGQAQTLYYFSSDLSDDHAGHSGLLTWCAALGPARGLLKAASYLMFTGGFDTTRKFLLGDCAELLQDDSGIPMKYFEPGAWTLKMLGAYHGPIATFKQFPQPELDQLTTAQKPAALPFSVGYRWHPGESSLIWALKTKE